MKKTLVVLLILAVAGGAFAQEVTFSGEVASGLLIEFNDVHAGTHPSYANSASADDDDDGRAVRARLNADVNDGNWGAQLGIQANYVDDNYGTTLDLYNAHGWATILDMVTIRGGLIDPGVWTVGGWVDKNVSSGLGLRVEAHPIEGLNIGVFIPAALTGAETDHAFIGKNVRSEGFAVGFSFEQEDFFKVSAAFGLYGVSNPEDYGYLPGEEGYSGKIIFGAGYYGMPGLGVYVGLEVADIINGQTYYDEKAKANEDKGYTRIGLNVDYDVTPELHVFLEAGVQLNGVVYAPVFDIEQNASGLALVEIKPGLTYAVTEDFQAGFDVKLTLKKNPIEWAPGMHGQTGEPSDSLGLSNIAPTLFGKYSIGNAWIKLLYGLDFVTADYSINGEWKDSKWSGDSSMFHKIGLFVGASF